MKPLPVDYYRYSAVKIADRDENSKYYKTSHLICRRAAANEAFILSEEISNINNINTETDITIGNK